MSYSTYEVDQPWVTYDYLSTDRQSRITGRAVILCTCAVCGERKKLRLRIPRFAKIDVPPDHKHVERIKFLLAHLHADRPRHPMSWAMPLLNPAAHKGGIDLDLLAMRLQADLDAAESS